jgi:hypothetical protein
MKDGEDGLEFGFKLVTVSLGTNSRGKEITSCVIEHTQTVPKADRKKEPKGATEKIVLQAAQSLIDLADTAVSVNDLIEASVNQIPLDAMDKRDRRREIVLRAIRSLVAAKQISTEGGIHVL